MNTFSHVVKIPAQNVSSFEASVGRLSRTAVKLGFAPFEMNRLYDIVVVEHKKTSITEYDGQHCRPIFHVEEKRSTVYEISGNEPVVDGWSMVAKIEQDGRFAEPLVKELFGKECPKEFYTGAFKNVCDHCGKNRQRNRVYVLTDGVDYKRVGHSCLKDFTRPEMKDIIEVFEKLFDCMTSFSGDDELDEERRGGRGVWMWDKSVLIAAMRLCQMYGYQTANSDNATSAIAQAAFFVRGDTEAAKDSEWLRESATEQERQLLNEILEAGRNIDPDTSNGYQHTVRLLCSATYWYPKDMNIIISWIGSYIKKTHEQTANAALEKLENRQESEYVGELGQKVAETLVLTTVLVFDSFYGIQHLHVGTNATGTVFNFYSKKKMGEVGDTISIKGTIKGYKEYKGVKQTTLFRVKSV